MATARSAALPMRATPSRSREGSLRAGRRHAWITPALAGGATVAFAANAILGRAAVGGGAGDPVAYTVTRVLSACIPLACLSLAGGRRARQRTTVKQRAGRRDEATPGSWTSALLLLLSPLASTAAFTALDAGVGALLFFGSVHATMLVGGLSQGERPHAGQTAGMVVALAGLIVLVSPGGASPSPPHAALMAGAGLAWGVYSLRGRRARSSTELTAGNHLRALPMALLAGMLILPSSTLSVHQVVLAIASGAAASTCGGLFWYAAVARLSSSRAGTVQLAVPVVAATGGVLLLGETLSPQLALGGVGVLCGVAVASAPRTSSSRTRPSGSPGSASAVRPLESTVPMPGPMRLPHVSAQPGRLATRPATVAASDRHRRGGWRRLSRSRGSPNAASRRPRPGPCPPPPPHSAQALHPP